MSAPDFAADLAVLHEVREAWSQPARWRFARALVEDLWRGREPLGTPPVLAYRVGDYTRAAEIARREGEAVAC